MILLSFSLLNDQNCRYGSILLADGRSLKDMCKELAYQSKLGDRAHQVARTGDVKSSSGSEEQGVLASSQRCESTWCINFGTRFSCQGQKIP